MLTAPGTEVQLFASEPMVRQPILVKCDDRGRLWVIQYLQYPNPAGLQRKRVDRWSRTEYDRVPEPPPRGPRGADRISILEDTDGDGSADVARDFLDGLNLATGLAFGQGGVYVLQVPYLLFYADRDRDDVPDGDPEVLLEGFGMEDAQSLANHLTWGPDGWLYGLNGSTTTCRIRGLEFQQGVWRYHPQRRQFELFCEGGGNLFGLTFDDKGRLFYSSNGNYLFFHAWPGAYYPKSFGKHGALHNPYAYGQLDHVAYEGQFQGPTTGGTIYTGKTLPKPMRGAFLAGNFLGHSASWWHVEESGSTVRATLGGNLLDARDTWFGPTDLCQSPDGSVYLSDFHDRRTAHPDPDAQWDRSNGRVYRLTPTGCRPSSEMSLESLSSEQLIEHVVDRDGALAERARRMLAERCEPDSIPRIRERLLDERDESRTLKWLWTLNLLGGFDDNVARQLLADPGAHVRGWTVRLLADDCEVSFALAESLKRLAAMEDHIVVRAELAAAAKRLPGHVALPILAELLARGLDADDPCVPLLCWWALESKADSDREQVLALAGRGSFWTGEIARDCGLRLARRYAAMGTQAGYDACSELWHSAPRGINAAMVNAIRQGLRERGTAALPVGQGDLFAGVAEVAAGTGSRTRPAPVEGPLRISIHEAWNRQPDDAAHLTLSVAAGLNGAAGSVIRVLGESESRPDNETVIALLESLRGTGEPAAADAALKILSGDHAEAVRLAAIDVIAADDRSEMASRLLDGYDRLPAPLKSRAVDALLGRPDWAAQLLQAVDESRIPPSDVAWPQLRIVAAHGRSELDALVHRHWGNVVAGTSEEKLATMRRLVNDLRSGPGDAALGQALFRKHCGTCHRLFGEGGLVGPELDAANRGDREFLLASLVDPSAVVRRQYITFTATTIAGRIVAGVLAEQDAASVILLDAQGQRVRVLRDEIEQLSETQTSLMPERILDPLSPQELRDLFAFLERTTLTEKVP